MSLHDIDQILIVGGTPFQPVEDQISNSFTFHQGGKASEAMAAAVVDQLRGAQRPLSGIISAPSPSEHNSTTVSPGKTIGGCVRVIYGGHPIPDEGKKKKMAPENLRKITLGK
jgi:hypothetical protein